MVLPSGCTMCVGSGVMCRVIARYFTERRRETEPPTIQNLQFRHPEVEINKRHIEWASHAEELPNSVVYVVNRFHTAWGHQIIYDFETLSALLAGFGFKDIRRCDMSKSEHEALNYVEGHFHIMPYDFCCLETMIVEGTK